MIDVFLIIISFFIFVLLQALMINGIHYCFQGCCIDEMNKGKICSGNVFYKIAPQFFERNKNKWWALPVYKCVRCMSSVYGTITFWMTSLMIFEFTWQMIIVWVFDIFILVSVNWFIYQKL